MEKQANSEAENQPEKAKSASKAKKQPGAIGETLSIIVQALILAVVLRTFFYQPFSIPSGSMKPQLLVGDYLFVSKFSYGFSKYSLPFGPDLFDGRIWSANPERGDIAVFKYPPDPRIDYIKRVIGLPGDKIQMSGGELFINGEAVQRERVSEDFVDPRESLDPIPVYMETLPNGVSYRTLDVNVDGYGDDTPVFEVPEGHYFMMGDNRDNSADSRFEVGFVPLENFVGRASVIFFSIDSGSHPLAVWTWPSDLRLGRLFSGI